MDIKTLLDIITDPHFKIFKYSDIFVHDDLLEEL